ncbi:MAG: DUF1015 family protein [Thermoleophilia bacterium]|nr:DUF1015 family protein [Thermoleophilia bacterium]
MHGLARGGAGMVNIGDTAVDDEYSKGHHLQLCLGDDRVVGGLSTLVEAVRRRIDAPRPVLSFKNSDSSAHGPKERQLETVVPFRAWRYAPKAGDLTRLVAPPYDVIGPELQSRLYAGSPYNVVRVDLGITTPSDTPCDNQYTRAAAQLAQWKERGVLVRDLEPAVTFVEESFTGPDGQPSKRHGFLAAMRLYDFDEGVVYPHERTLSGPKEDRYRLMTATTMSLSPVFLLYDLPGDEITAAWRAGVGAQDPAASTVDESDTATKLWPTSDPDLLDTIREHLENARFVVADGHHRYETALRYRDQRRAGPAAEAGSGAEPGRRPPGGAGPTGAPAYDYALAYFSNMADPGLAIYGTHRLVAGLPAEVVAALPRSLSGTFEVDRLTGGGEPPRAVATASGAGAAPSSAAAEAQAAIAAYLAEHPRRAFGLWSPGFDAAYGLRLTDAAAARTAEPGRSAVHRELDVTILQTLVLGKALGISAADMAAERHVTFFKDPGEAFARLAAGDFQAGFFMNPTGLDQIRQVAFSGERMPQKATFFYPKLPTGLVLHDLEGSLWPIPRRHRG